MGVPLIANSSPIALDTRAPQSISILSANVSGGSSIFCAWNAATDANFSHYEIWYGTNQSDVQNRTGIASKWGPGEDASLSNIITISTTITGLTPGDIYFLSIFAIDQFGQETQVDYAGSLTLQTEIVSSNFDLDTRAPQTLATLDITRASGTSVDATWVAATDANFSHYEIWYGTNQSDVQNRTGTASEWDDGDDANLATIGTTATTVTGLTPGTVLYFSIFAIDDFGQETRVDYPGTIVMFLEGSDEYDGALVVADTITVKHDGYIKVFETNPNHFFGKLRVYDVAIELFDGDFHVGHDDADLFNGTISVEELAENQFDGSIYVIETSAILFDGATEVIGGAVPQFDGTISVHEVFSLSFDGTTFIFSSTTAKFDGIFDIKGAAVLFDGLLAIEALPQIGLLRPRDEAIDVKESTGVHIEFEGFPGASGGGLDPATTTIVMLEPEFLTIYDGSNPSAFPDVAVSGDSSRLAYDFRAPFDEDLFPVDSTMTFDLSIANEVGQFIDYAYNFDTRGGSDPEFRRGEAIYEYDMGTEEINVKQFQWTGDGLIKMRLKFADDPAELRQARFEGEESESFRGTTVNTATWDIDAPVFGVSQNEVLIVQGTQAGTTDIWENETRLGYVGVLTRSYNVAIDTRLNINKSVVTGARSFLEMADAAGRVVRAEKIYRGLPSATGDGSSSDIVPDENVTITGAIGGQLSTSNVFPQTLFTTPTEVITSVVDVAVNDIALTELERVRIRFSGSAPSTVDITVNGTYSVNGIMPNSSEFFEATEESLFPSPETGTEETVERLHTVRIIFQAPDTTTTISDLEILSAAEILDTRLRVVIDGIEEFNVGIAVDPLRFDQLKMEVERNSIDVLFNGESVYRRYMKFNNPRFTIGAGARNNGDSLIAEFDNLIIRRYFDRSPVALNVAQRYAAYEVTMKAPKVD